MGKTSLFETAVAAEADEVLTAQTGKRVVAATQPRRVWPLAKWQACCL